MINDSILMTEKEIHYLLQPRKFDQQYIDVNTFFILLVGHWNYSNTHGIVSVGLLTPIVYLSR